MLSDVFVKGVAILACDWQCWMVEMIIVAAYRAHPPRSTQYHKTIIVAGVHEQFIQNDAIQVLVL